MKICVSSLVLALATVTVSAQDQPWWPVIKEKFEDDVVRLRKCSKKNNIAPTDGDRCSKRPKTCFFGSQTCDGSPYPDERCVCSGDPDREWDCEPEACPGPCDDFDPGNSPNCPAERQEPNTACTVEQEGAGCSWGVGECCGVCYSGYGCGCSNGQWFCYYNDQCLGSTQPGGCNGPVIPLPPSESPPCPASDPGSCTVYGQTCQFVTSSSNDCDEAAQTGYYGTTGDECLCNGSVYVCENQFATLTPCFPEATPAPAP